ncbi:MAG: Uma2 family endonuclease [Chloroflexia bacterium]|nr:Uma2 family endonuclease [Chloroflexia bacterium]
MAVAQRMNEEAYLEFVLSGVEGAWELHDGRLVEKPGMSWDHGRIVTRLISSFDQQLDPADIFVFAELRVRRQSAIVFLPDLMVVPATYSQEFRNRPVLAIFSDPLPLVVEVWSPSTGEYDVDAKLPIYQQRGDLEIWRFHPYERTLTSWQRQSDGSYVETLHRSGTIAPMALPGVTIDLGTLLNL